MKQLIIFLSLACCAASLFAQGTAATAQPRKSTSEQFQETYDVLMKADIARDRQDTAIALRFYQDAMSRYINLLRDYPHLDAEVVRFRINYCNTQIEALTGGQPLPRSTPPENTQPSPAAHQQPKPSATTEADIAMARRMITENNPQQAIELLLTLFAQQPGSLQIQLLIGAAQCRAGRFEDGLSMARGILEDHADSASAYSLMGMAHFGLSQFQEAAVATKKALELNPQLQEAHFNMTQIVLATLPLDAEAARYHYKKSIELGGAQDPSLDYLLK
jgi:tetratricopeptide (TPR) repeat protein